MTVSVSDDSAIVVNDRFGFTGAVRDADHWPRGSSDAETHHVCMHSPCPTLKGEEAGLGR